MKNVNESGGDARPAIGGWAPGSYECLCIACQSVFIGDKRAMCCADCAYKPANQPPAIPPEDGAREGVPSYHIGLRWENGGVCLDVTSGYNAEWVKNKDHLAEGAFAVRELLNPVRKTLRRGEHE